MGAKDIVKYQFKPGQSGNPAGRAKGVKIKRIKDFIEAVLDERTTVKKDGTKNAKLISLTKRELMVRNIMKKAVMADPWFVQFVTERTEGKTPDKIIMTDPDTVVEIG